MRWFTSLLDGYRPPATFEKREQASFRLAPRPPEETIATVSALGEERKCFGISARCRLPVRCRGGGSRTRPP